jgi:hypothetical protein
MKKFILFIFTMLVLIGCNSYKSSSSSDECINCQRLIDTLTYFKEKEHAEKIVLAEFKDEYEHKAGSEVPWEDFEKIIIQLAGCCASSPHPLSNEWEEYEWMDCIWEYLGKEIVQRIAFYGHVNDADRERPEDWNGLWAEITERERIKDVLQLLHESTEKEKNRFANEGIVVGHADRMQIITNKHKFIVPIGCSSQEDEAIRGLGWTSYKLRKKLAEWGFSNPR